MQDNRSTITSSGLTEDDRSTITVSLIQCVCLHCTVPYIQYECLFVYTYEAVLPAEPRHYLTLSFWLYTQVTPCLSTWWSFIRKKTYYYKSVIRIKIWIWIHVEFHSICILKDNFKKIVGFIRVIYIMLLTYKKCCTLLFDIEPGSRSAPMNFNAGSGSALSYTNGSA